MSFGAETTAEEILAGVDVVGKRVLITGASAGIGAETARVLLKCGATVVGAVRDVDKARAALSTSGHAAGTGSLELVALDLASLASVSACAEQLIHARSAFDVIICNAGIMAVPHGLTVDGFETQFGTNYIGHFALVNRLATLLAPGGRVVVLSSAGHRGADVDMDDPDFERSDYDPLLAYRRSKTALILMTVEFDRRYRDRGVRATAVHPGAVLTETARKLLDAQPSAASRFQWKTPAQGAATSVWAGFAADAKDVGGRYCEDCHVAEVNDDPTSAQGVRSYALDRGHARAFWESTELRLAGR